jgi:hypothetical protein
MTDVASSCEGQVEFVQGDIVDVVLYLKDECNADAPINLTGCTVFQAGFIGTPSNVIITLGSGVTILDAAAGAVQLVLSAAQSAQVTASTYNTKTATWSKQDIEIHYEIGATVAKTLTIEGVLVVKSKKILP